MGPPDNAKLARMTLGKPCQASYWAPRASHPSGDSEIKVSVRVLSVDGVQSGAKRSNSGSTDSQRLLALSWLQLSGLCGGIGLITQRSVVQIHPPQPTSNPSGYVVCVAFLLSQR